MTRSFEADTFDELFIEVVKDIYLDAEYECRPRGQVVKELIAPTLVLTNPRARILANKERAADYGFGVGEFLWYWAGRQDLASILYYNKRMKDFSDNGTTLNSAYGYRVKTESTVVYYPDLSSADYVSQWLACKNELMRDKDSRRAILIINRAEDNVIAATVGSKDVPCTLSLQFFIRNNKLYLHTSMRSNDAFWGLTYDLFSFTLLQECLMLELNEAGMNLTLGSYSHTAGSLHIYDRHFDQASVIVENYLRRGSIPAAPMLPISLEELASLADQEVALRTGKVAEIGETQFSSGVRWMAECLNKHRRKRDGEREQSLGSCDGNRSQVI